MKIHGLQKMTLLDYPGKVACTVFLGGCEFRCPFCHNADLLDPNAPAQMDDEELLRFLKTRTGLLDGVAITGGEPLLRQDLPDLLVRIRDLGYLVKIDTNGNHPARLKRILDEGLADYVAMDVKNSPQRYGETVGIPGFDMARISESIGILLSSDTEYEFRTTVVKQFHDEASFEEIGPWIRGAKRYFLQGFVDRDTVPFAGLEAWGKEEMERFADIVRPFVKNVDIRGL